MRSLILALAFGGSVAASAADVVFVCEKGVAKSLVAATIFEQRAKARGLELTVASRGMVPKPEVPPVVKERLAARGRDVSGYQAQALTAADAAGARRVVSFDVDATVVAPGAAIERWDGLPPVTLDYPAFEAETVKRVDALLDSLAPPAKR